MSLKRRTRRGTATRAVLRGRSVLLLACLACLLLPEDATAQRPFRVFDPFYQNESARRSFFDGYAVTAEVSYRPAGLVRNEELPTGASDPLGVSVRLDYRLLPQFDVSAIVDASGSYAGRKLALSWIVLQYYRTVEMTDYAFRLAVDPSYDALTGFPQMDLAFLYTSLLAPNFSADYVLGVRRVNMGFQDWVRAEVPDDAFQHVAQTPGLEVIFTRALGWEAHVMMQYAVLLNPARSNIFGSLVFEGGQYNLFENFRRPAEDTNRLNASIEEPETRTREYRGGVMWAQAGVEYNRPGYQLAPFVSLPFLQWASEDDISHRVHFGLRLMLR